MRTHGSRSRGAALLMAVLGLGCAGQRDEGRDADSGIVVPVAASDETVDELGISAWEVQVINPDAFAIVGRDGAGTQIARVTSTVTQDTIALELVGPSSGTLTMNGAEDVIEGDLSSTVVLERYVADAEAEGFREGSACSGSLDGALGSCNELNLLAHELVHVMQQRGNVDHSLGEAVNDAARNASVDTAKAGVDCASEVMDGDSTSDEGSGGASEGGEGSGGEGSGGEGSGGGESGRGESGGGESGGGESGGGESGGGETGGGESGGGESGGYGESGGGYGTGGYADDADDDALAPLDTSWAIPLLLEAETPLDASHWNLR